MRVVTRETYFTPKALEMNAQFECAECIECVDSWVEFDNYGESVGLCAACIARAGEMIREEGK